MRTAYLLTGDGLVAEELVQDTLVRLYPKWHLVRAAEVPLAYVRRSLANGFVNHTRRASRRETAVDFLPTSLTTTTIQVGSTIATSCGACCGRCRTGNEPRWCSATSTICPTTRSGWHWVAASAPCAA